MNPFAPKPIRPEVGRIVHFYPGVESSTYDVLNPATPMAAQVCYVWGDNRVNLSVTDHAGNVRRAANVTLVQPGQDDPRDRAEGFQGIAYRNAHHPFCQWMPYQVATAAKAEDGK